MNPRSKAISLALAMGMLGMLAPTERVRYPRQPKDRSRMTTAEKQADNRKQRAKKRKRGGA